MVGVTPEGVVQELGGRKDHTTNNRMEMMAAIEGLRTFLPQGVTEVRTDSSYLINGATKWLHGWKRNGWQTSAKKSVENQDLWLEISALLERGKASFVYVPGHQGVPGNERADAIARESAAGERVRLYHGPLSSYEVDILRPLGATSKKKNGKVYSYVSLVDGAIEKHTSWKACEARVRGAKGARFRKTHSPEDEASVIKEWRNSR